MGSASLAAARLPARPDWDDICIPAYIDGLVQDCSISSALAITRTITIWCLLTHIYLLQYPYMPVSCRGVIHGCQRMWIFAIQWHGNVAILTRFSSLEAPEVLKITLHYGLLQLMMKLSPNWWHFRISTLRNHMVIFRICMSNFVCLTTLGKPTDVLSTVHQFKKNGDWQSTILAGIMALKNEK